MERVDATDTAPHNGPESAWELPVTRCCPSGSNCSPNPHASPNIYQIICVALTHMDMHQGGGCNFTNSITDQSRLLNCLLTRCCPLGSDCFPNPHIAEYVLDYIVLALLKTIQERVQYILCRLHTLVCSFEIQLCS